MLGLYWTVWDMYMQVLYLGRALRTKETLSDFLKWRRVTRHPLVFRGLMGSQRTLGIAVSHYKYYVDNEEIQNIIYYNFKFLNNIFFFFSN